MRSQWRYQIKLGKDYGEKSPVFDYFDIVIVGEDIVLVPSDVWERKETAYRPSLNDFFSGRLDNESIWVNWEAKHDYGSCWKDLEDFDEDDVRTKDDIVIIDISDK